MSKYKEIKGFKVQTLATDTAASVISTGSWASAPNTNTARYVVSGFAGTATANLIFGGTDPANNQTANTERWNGSTWTEVNNLNTTRRALAGFGTNTAAIGAGGYSTTAKSEVESWNGTSWSEVNESNTSLEDGGGAGTQTAGLRTGGQGPYSNTAETFDGTNWTNIATMNAVHANQACFGTQTAAVVAGGQPPSGTPALVEVWDGSSWTEVAELNTPRIYGTGCAGISTDGMVYGGDPGSKNETEIWNGSSWTEVNNLGTGRGAGGGGGTTSAAILSGGNVSPYQQTEEWSTTPAANFTKQNLGQVYYNSGSNAFKVTAQPAAGGSWASGGDLNTARSRFGGAGQATQSAALVFGAGAPPYGQTEEYNGTAWSEQNDMNTGRYISPGGAGTQTAALTAGGYNPAGSPVYNTVNSESYNGTSWTEGNNLNEGRIDCVTFGSSTAAILVGGGEASGGPGTVSSVEIYDGTSWTETTNIPTATQEMAGWGIQTSGAIVGGSVDSDPTMKNTTVEWDGTSWSSGGNYSRNNKYFQAFGSSVTAGLAAGGENPGESPARLSIAAVYNGTSWSEVAELSSARYGTAGGGTTTSGLISGGETAPTTVASTEEWTVPEANTTITVS
jgi:hypothetical protein